MDFSQDALSGLVMFYNSIDVFLLILVRVVAFLFFIPVISSLNIPVVIRMLIALCVTVVIFVSGTVSISTVVYNNTVPGYFVLVLTEFMAGILMGFIIFAIFNLLYYAGHWIDYEIGFAMVNVVDPMAQIQVPIVGNLYYLAIAAILVVSGGLNGIIGAFYQSYAYIPIGTANIIGNSQLAYSMLLILTNFIIIGIRIAMPIVGAILVINVALGILVKTVPQMNIFVVGMPIKLLVGLILLFNIMGPTLESVYYMVFGAAYDALLDAIWGMSP